MDLSKVAPTLAKYIDAAAMEADLKAPALVEKKKPTLTKAKVESVYEALKAGKGDLEIAQEVNLWQSQVKDLRKELNAAKSEVNKGEE
jgi:hypothetical protein|tara:strand:+ start:967 stop:1230 length:264 start_codon:yes stop_codon:yes gene_type:complete